jgi:hypothetical protein
VRQERRLFHGAKRLIGFRRVFMMIRVALHLEKEVVSEAMRRVPAMQYVYFLVLTIWKEFSL